MQQESPSTPKRASLWASASLVFLALASLSSCSIHFDITDDHGVFGHRHEGEPTQLSKVETNDGRTTTYSLSGRPRHFPDHGKAMQAGILISTTAALNLPYLGLNVASIGNAKAETLKVAPWRGVLVTKVEADSAAGLADLQRGDLIVSVNGAPIKSEEQFADFVSASLVPGEEVDVEVSREVAEDVREDIVVPLVVGSRSIEETEADRVNLPIDGSLVASAGLGVVTVSPELADEIYGVGQATPLVSAVVTGSPAYFAGVRAGDRILRANGSLVDTVDDLRLQVQRSDGTLDLQLDGPLGPHVASFEVEEDVLVESDFQIPIIVDYESRADRMNLSVLEFIFLFGYSKDVEYLPSKTRKVNRTKHVSILPLGMFEYTRTPTKRTNRIFWFITWSSKV